MTWTCKIRSLFVFVVVNLFALQCSKFHVSSAKERERVPSWPMEIAMNRATTMRWMLLFLSALFIGSNLRAQGPSPALPVLEPEPAPVRLGAPPDAGLVPVSPMAPPSVSTTGRRTGGKDRVRLTLDDGSQLIGEIVGASKFQIKASYGELALPLKDVGRLERDFQEKKVRVTMSNGDRITGEIALESVKFKTDWGEMAIAKDRVETIEVGTLHEARVPVTRASPDGRTMVTVYHTRRWFQPQIGSTSDVPTNVPTYPQPPPSVYSVPSIPTPADSSPSLPAFRPSTR